MLQLTMMAKKTGRKNSKASDKCLLFAPLLFWICWSSMVIKTAMCLPHEMHADACMNINKSVNKHADGDKHTSAHVQETSTDANINTWRHKALAARRAANTFTRQPLNCSGSSGSLWRSPELQHPPTIRSDTLRGPRGVNGFSLEHMKPFPSCVDCCKSLRCFSFSIYCKSAS